MRAQRNPFARFALLLSFGASDAQSLNADLTLDAVLTSLSRLSLLQQPSLLRRAICRHP